MLSTRNGSHSSQVVKVTRADKRFWKIKTKAFQLSVKGDECVNLFLP